MSEFSSRLTMLRSLTSEHHAHIETVPALAKLLDPDLERADYAGVLVKLLSFHASLEAKIRVALSPTSSARTLLDNGRIMNLQADLQWLGVHPASASVSVPVIETHAAALGALYVVEGSGLGGRVIARSLSRHLGLRHGHGASFYDGMTAEDSRARWKLLCDALEASDGPSCDQDMVRAAQETFSTLDHTLRQVPLRTKQTCLTAVAAD
jgi:heme oxygenase